MKYFKSIKSFNELKGQFRVLAQKNHPDAGGSSEIMKEINCEYDALFPIWKNRQEVATGEKSAETANSTRRRFYTDWGWEGSRYNLHLSTREIAKTIKIYCKEKYPTWKFSVTSEHYAGGSSINISLMEAPIQIFDLDICRKSHAEFLEDIKNRHRSKNMEINIEKMIEEDKMNLQLHHVNDSCKIFFTEYGFSVILDVFNFMLSFNCKDSDAMIDYFSSKFYCSFDIGKWDKGFKVVTKTARINRRDFIVTVNEEDEPISEAL